MGLFKDLFGAGGAEIDAEVGGQIVQPGGTLQGVVHIKGGDRRQELRGLRLTLQCVAEREIDDGEYHITRRLGEATLPEGQAVQPGQRIDVPFAVAVPFECPPNRMAGLDFHGIRLTLATRLDIDGAKDANDLDTVVVNGLPAHEATLHAMDRLGFQLHSADVEEGNARAGHLHTSLGVYAEYEYRGQGTIKEVEITFVTTERETGVLVEIDKKGRYGFSGGDRVHAFAIPTQGADVDPIVEQLRRVLAR